MKKIDIRSFIIGILVMALVLIIMGSNISSQSNSSIGKYQIAAAATSKTPKYIIIDTETGNIVKTGFISTQ